MPFMLNTMLCFRSASLLLPFCFPSAFAMPPLCLRYASHQTSRKNLYLTRISISRTEAERRKWVI